MSEYETAASLCSRSGAACASQLLALHDRDMARVSEALNRAIAERDHAREEWHRQNERADDYRRQLLDDTERAEQLVRAVNENADMIVALRDEADDLRRQLLNETYRPEGAEIVLRELRRAQRDRDEARAKVAAVEALCAEADARMGAFRGVEVPLPVVSTGEVRAALIRAVQGRENIPGNIPAPKCWCARCDAERRSMLPWPARLCAPFIVCPECGDKRCPRAAWHGAECGGRR